MVHRLDDPVGDRLLDADLHEALLRGRVHLLGLRHRIEALLERSAGLEDPIVPDAFVDGLDHFRANRGVRRPGLRRVDPALPDDGPEDGRLELRQRRGGLRLVLARVHVEGARRIRDAGAPHRLPVRPDVLDVRDDADDEDAVHLGAEGRDDVRRRTLAGALGLQVRVVVLGGEEPPGHLADHADPSRPSSISRASACTSTLRSFADSTIIMSP